MSGLQLLRDRWQLQEQSVQEEIPQVVSEECLQAHYTFSFLYLGPNTEHGQARMDGYRGHYSALTVHSQGGHQSSIDCTLD